MARIKLRNTNIRLVDGYSNTAAVNDTLAVGDTSMAIDTLGTAGEVPPTCRFTVAGSADVYTVVTSDGEAVLTLDLDDASAGNFTVTVAGQTTANIAYDATAADVLAAIELLSTVNAGDFTVTGTGVTNPAGTPFLVSATSYGQYAGTAVTLSGDDTGLTATASSFTQTTAGGSTSSITFTPALTTGNVPADDAVITFTGRTLEVKVGEGNATYTQKKEFNYDLDRGNLDTVREGDQQPMDWTLDFTWEFLTAVAGAPTPTIEDVFDHTGPAAYWISSSADPCEPYAIDIEIEYVPACGSAQLEVITIPDARYESLEHNVDDATVSASGRSNSITALKVRRTKNTA